MSTQLQSNRLKTNSTVSITVELPADEIKLLNRLAELSGRTRQSLVKKFIMDGSEDLGDGLIARDAIEEVRSGKGRMYTHEEVWGELGLGD